MFQLSNWLVGIASGYTPPGVLPTETIAGTIAVSSVLGFFKSIDKHPKGFISAPIGTIFGISFAVGSVFFLGHQVGVGLRCAVKGSSERREE